MRIFVRREYGTDGPYSLEQLQYLLDNGAVTFGDMVWVDGAEDWVPLSQVEVIYARPAPDLGSFPIEEGAQVRPWVRFWARSIDNVIIGIVVAIPFGLVLPDESQNRVVDQLIQYLALALWIPIEAVLLANFGFTPGKALLRVRVTNKNGSKLNFWQALSRAFGVWWRGLGTGLIPLVTLITNISSYRRLTERGVTYWDREGRFKVT